VEFFKNMESDNMQLFTLDTKGIFSAIALALLIIYFGGSYGLFFFSLLFLFLVLSALATGIGRRKKIRLGLYEKSRGWKNVAANGTIPLLIAIIFYFEHSISILLALSYIASIAAITADKFASEIGVLDGSPISLLQLKRVDKGVSGGVTLLGLGASAFASFIISLSSFVIIKNYVPFLIIFIAGFLGNIVDSLLGYYEEKGIGNKHTTNVACSLSGALIAFAFLAILGF
jgi:uncharacterized protein (TIGR00297 family)